MTVLSEHYTLSNGVTIPKLGFGTWQTPDRVAPSAVEMALRAGYTHIDTASAYENERGVGKGLRASGKPRDEVFVTTKVRAEYKSYAQAKASIERSLADLQESYADLILIHAPRPWREMSSHRNPYHTENIAVWQALQEAYAAGQARAIGVSNFAVDDITNLTEHCDIAPMVNQICFHVGYTQPEITAYCQANGILVQAYSPLGTGSLLTNAQIGAVAEKYGASVAQVCIRYALQKGTNPLPKSTHEEYIIANTEVDFVLSPDDMLTLDGIRTRAG